MDELFTGNGFLTEKGNSFISDFRYSLHQIMQSDEVSEMTESELRTLESNLHKLVGDAISKYIARIIQFTHELNAMTDKQFYTFLKNKYGKNWMLQSLVKEERDRLPRADLQKIANNNKYLSEDLKKYFIQNGVRFK